MVTAAILTSILLFEYIVALWGIPQVLPNLPDYGSSLILVVPYIVEIVSFNGILSQIYYILLILAITATVGIFLYKAVEPLKKLKDGDDKTIRNTAFYEVTVLFCVLYIWELIFVMILRAAGVEIEGLPDRDTWKWMYELLEASVWEEVITRLLFIGLPMMLITSPAIQRMPPGRTRRLSMMQTSVRAGFPFIVPVSGCPVNVCG